MTAKNKVFIATSIDGYISDFQGGIDWLNSIPNPDNIDFGYNEFMMGVDALIMGRTTFETVCSFDIDWPYQKKVFVLSNSMGEIPNELKDKAQLVKGDLIDVLNHIHNLGFYQLYIDGGKTIQGFLKQDLIHEMIITTIPILLGGGTSLFSELNKQLAFECTASKIYLDKIVQNHFKRVGHL